jgi:aminoglycoside 6'-N-acetyltransferase I
MTAQRLTIRPARPSDAPSWLRMRCALWPDGTSLHLQEIAAFFAGETSDPGAVFLAESDRNCVAFLELAFRTDLRGFIGQKVGYIEGLYIEPGHRGKKLIRLLLRTSEAWARKERCLALASDRAGRVIFDPYYSLLLTRLSAISWQRPRLGI